jgi:hypothetical protein
MAEKRGNAFDKCVLDGNFAIKCGILHRLNKRSHSLNPTVGFLCFPQPPAWLCVLRALSLYCFRVLSDSLFMSCLFVLSCLYFALISARPICVSSLHPTHLYSVRLSLPVCSCLLPVLSARDLPVESRYSATFAS